MYRPGGLTALPALVVIVLVVAGPPAEAQYRPPPLPEPERPVDPEPPISDTEVPAELDAPEKVAESESAGWGWDKYVSLDGIWESNVGFTSPPAGDDFVGAVAASASRWRRSRRSQWRTTLSGAGYVYAENSQLNRMDGAAATTIRKVLHPRLSTGMRGGYSYGHTDTDYGLVLGGTVLPPSRMQTADAGAGLDWRLGQKTDLTLDASWLGMWFEREGLQDATTLTASATLARRLNLRDSVLLTVQYRRTEDRLVRHDPGVSVGYRRLLISKLALELGAGANRITTGGPESPEMVPEGWFLMGTAGLTGSIRRTVLVARYQHGVDPTVGYGIVEETDLFTLSATVPIGRSAELIGTGGYAIRGDPSREGLSRRHDLDFYVGASTRLSRRTRIVAGYRFRRRDGAGSTDAVRNDRASVSIVWGPEYVQGGR